ncbi:MAG: phosphatase PAP2 family protein [Prevotella sp.]|uniref:phosphatase PAP2 family protein n=1 Tax=Prevotella sp. TaxID=59823 RepID=UPI002A2D3E0C|nr:phosphatase PAP2 family protein [Prevotella sp.]MDD7318466.1 phosphatase PAP2 family protein [Prevotellaceae bacterium]MDY4020183.1 phosphatase PAP2 family protein [Prevotella sp.]
MTEKRLILLSRVISSVISPFYLPMFGMIVLFMFTYLGMLDPWIKLRVLLIVYIFTVIIPTYLIRLYHYYHGWTPIQIGSKERRMVPYVIAIVCYFVCYYIMNLLHMPHFIGTVIMAALMLQVACALVNLRWKVSTHAAAIGGVIGALIAFSFLFSFNPTWWLFFLFFMSGLVGTSRMILRQHTLTEVSMGFLMGIAVAFLSVMFYRNIV